MIDLLHSAPAQLFGYFLILLRISGIILTAPVISMETVPRMLRVYMAVLISMILFSYMPTRPLVPNFSAIDYLLLVVKELMIGLLLGFIPRLMFAAVEFAGTIIGFQMGLSMANVVDPQSQLQVSVIASLETLVATLLFVTLDGHHVFFEALASSYEYLPVGSFTFHENKIDFLLRVTANLFIIGLKLGAPIVVALFLTNAILGFMARSMPQLNVFVVGFPLTILMGLLFLVTGMPYFVKALQVLFLSTSEQLMELMKAMNN